MIRLQFIGATGTVTGSKYRIEFQKKHYLLDCGLFQGLKVLRLRNWRPLPVKPSLLEAVILTHAHIDHSGYLPLLVKNGFRGKIYSTRGTRALCQILLPDAGHLQEEDAFFANKHKFSRHRPALPLYTVEDVQKALALFVPVEYGRTLELSKRFSVRLVDAGHILGSAMVEVRVADGVRERKVLVSGDIGRYDMPLHRDPDSPPECDVLLLESTYGGRRHGPQKPEEELLRVARLAVASKGILVIPAFAVGRTGVFIPAGSILSGAMDLEGFIRLLARGAYRRIAMANPEHAPFGVAAREALQSAGVWAVERDRVLLAENAAQAVQFTFSGSVDAGIIPYSFALLPEIRDKGRFFLFPADWHHPLEQIMVLLKNAGAEARSFADFLRTETARGILEESGYSAPGME